MLNHPPAGAGGGTNHTAQAVDVPPHLPGRGAPNITHSIPKTTRTDLEEARLRLEGHDLLGQIINNATLRIKKESLLDPDGTNLAQWIKDLKELAREHLANSEFFFNPCDNAIFERIGRAIILAKLHSNLTYEFQDYPNCHHIYKAITKKFRSINRAGQINVWQQLVDFKLDETTSTVGLSAKLQGWFREWTNMNVKIDWDVFLGFVVQNGIPIGSRLRDEVDRRIKQLVKLDDRKPITLAVVLHILEACRQKLQHKNRDGEHGGKSMSVFAINSNDATASKVFPEICYPIEDYLNQINESKWDRAVANYASKAAQCWNCGMNGHVKRSCPNKARPWMKPAGHQYSHFMPNPFPSNNQQIFPIFGAVYPPVSSSYTPPQTVPGNTNARSHQLGLQAADYYRPPQARSGPPRTTGRGNGGPGPASARMVELGSLPNDLSNLTFNNLGASGDNQPRDHQTLSLDLGH